MQLSSSDSALLVMDYQVTLIDNYLQPDRAAEVLRNTASLLKMARSKGLKVFYIKLQFQHNYPEISDGNKVFLAIKEHKLFLENDSGTAIHPAVLPLKNDAIVIKHRIGAFSATSLDIMLRAQGINSLIIAGLITSGVVLSTVRQAFDLDYQLFVAKDCCADPDEEVHRILMSKVFPCHAEVLSQVLLEKIIN